MSTVLITGGHAGLGLIGAQTLAMRFGCNLILAARNPGKAGGAADKLRTETGVRVEVLEMDLNSLASVRRAAEQCKMMLKAAPAADERASRDDMGRSVHAGARGLSDAQRCRGSAGRLSRSY